MWSKAPRIFNGVLWLGLQSKIHGELLHIIIVSGMFSTDQFQIPVPSQSAITGRGVCEGRDEQLCHW